jgi:hypothetical protein
MSEFKKVPHAQMSPTTCALCGAHEGPFIDTHWETPVYGHVYICASNSRRAGCIRQMARLDGMVEEKHLGEVIAREQELNDEIAALQSKFDQSRIVDATAFLNFMDEKGLVLHTGTGTSSSGTVTLKQTRKPKEE